MVAHVGRAFDEEAVPLRIGAGYSFFSTGAAAGAGGGGAAGVAIGSAGAGGVSATGASCQWPCSTDHTFPAGTSPGGWGAEVNFGWDGAVGKVKVCAGGVPPAAGEADCVSAAGGLDKK